MTGTDIFQVNIDKWSFSTGMDIIPASSSVFWKAGRLRTFEHWPFNAATDTCTPERMAAAGFLAIGGPTEPDLVECFICSKQLDGWERNDDPWTEHVRHEPNCAFVRLNKRDETAWTVAELFDFVKLYVVKECNQTLERAKNDIMGEGTKLVEKIPSIYRELSKNRK